MTESEIKNLVRQEMKKYDANSRFGVQSIQYHVHNGVDAPLVYMPVMSYVGTIPYDGGANTALSFILPKNWTVEISDDGAYIVTHNLGSFNYSVVASPTQSTNLSCVPVILTGDNSFSIRWFISGDTSEVATSFNFILTQIDNKKTNAQIYDSRVNVLP